MVDHNRRYERIELSLACRLFIPENKKPEKSDMPEKSDKPKRLLFEAFTNSQNLGLGGVFVESTFLLRPGVELWVELGLPTEALAIPGRIAHTIPLDNKDYPSGMGIEFLDVSSHAREVLLRYFTPQRYHDFYSAVMSEFPHLTREFEAEDISLLVNLWEEWNVRREGGPASTSSGSPEALPRKTSR